MFFIFIFLFNLDVKYGLLNVLNGYFFFKGFKVGLIVMVEWLLDC